MPDQALLSKNVCSSPGSRQSSLVRRGLGVGIGGYVREAGAIWQVSPVAGKPTTSGPRWVIFDVLRYEYKERV